MSRSQPHANRVFFLGGQDLEMVTIRSLLEENGCRFFDRRLGWGAKTSDYRAEIEKALARGQLPVLVELEDDLGLDEERVLVIDHHGERASATASTALEQVFALLGLGAERWDRRLELVAANDRAYLQGLKACGAGVEEARRLRAEDRAAQGVTAAEEEQAATVARAAESRCGGRLLVARMPHARTAPLVDRLDARLGGPGFENLVVLSPGEINVFGRGEIIAKLNEAFPGGWYGGALPEEGYWGSLGRGEEVIRRLESWLGAKDRVAVARVHQSSTSGDLDAPRALMSAKEPNR